MLMQDCTVIPASWQGGFLSVCQQALLHSCQVLTKMHLLVQVNLLANSVHRKIADTDSQHKLPAGVGA